MSRKQLQWNKKVISKKFRKVLELTKKLPEEEGSDDKVQKAEGTENDSEEKVR